VTVSITLLFVAYYQIPTRGDGGDSDAPPEFHFDS